MPILHGVDLRSPGASTAFGAWRLTHAQLTERGPRPPGLDGAFTIVLLDVNGTELYREPLTPISLSDGGEAGWGIAHAGTA